MKDQLSMNTDTGQKVKVLPFPKHWDNLEKGYTYKSPIKLNKQVDLYQFSQLYLLLNKEL